MRQGDACEFEHTTTTSTSTSTMTQCGPGERLVISDNACLPCRDGSYQTAPFPHQLTECIIHNYCDIDQVAPKCLAIVYNNHGHVRIAALGATISFKHCLEHGCCDSSGAYAMLPTMGNVRVAPELQAAPL